MRESSCSPGTGSPCPVATPVLAYVAGFTVPPGKTMGHAGAIVSGSTGSTGSTGSAQAKARALEDRGVRVGRTPTEVAQLATEMLAA
jgi:succinyl-CoA synthetase alpha subunit